MKSLTFAIGSLMAPLTIAGYAQVHGSGTTNPQNCFALIMQQFQDRTKLPIKMTYRGVGTETGQAEFLGVNNNGSSTYIPYTDFGCGDLPLSTTQYTSAVQATGDNVVIQLPFLLGAVSFFHNIPNVTSISRGLNMTGCLLARIFTRNITTWDHPDILQVNEGLSTMLTRRNYPITVAHRVLGSSSTAGITNVCISYLQYLFPSQKSTLISLDLVFV
jgi:ABC-type phosphate transport system substrate-binding protein